MGKYTNSGANNKYIFIKFIHVYLRHVLHDLVFINIIILAKL